MAAFLPDTKTLKCVTSISDEDGHVDQSRFFLTYAGTAPSDAELVVMATAASGAVDANLMPYCTAGKLNSAFTITDLTSDTSAQGEYGVGANGTLAGGLLPASSALCVSQTTGRRYRGGHSRVYLPVGDDSKLNDTRTWTNVFAGDVAVAWSEVVAGAAGGAWSGAGTITAVMASFYLGFTNEPYGSPTKYRRVPTPRAPAVNYDVVNYVGQVKIATQRRRLRQG
jgi:hypothetical protein